MSRAIENKHASNVDTRGGAIPKASPVPADYFQPPQWDSRDSLPIILPASEHVRFKLLDAVIQPIQKLTLQRLCELAGISKQAFYNNFSSKYDIAYWYLSLCESIAFGPISSLAQLRQNIGEYITLIAMKREQLRNAFPGQAGPPHSTKWFESSVDHACSTIESSGLAVDPRLRLCIQHYVRERSTMIATWCRGEADCSPEAFAELCFDCVPHALTDHLSRTPREPGQPSSSKR